MRQTWKPIFWTSWIASSRVATKHRRSAGHIFRRPQAEAKRLDCSDSFAVRPIDSAPNLGEASVIGPICVPAQKIVCAWIIASHILTSRSPSPFVPMLCAVTRAPSSNRNSSSASISGSASAAAAHS